MKTRHHPKTTGPGVRADEWQALCEKYEHRCAACGESAPLTVDHVVPISKGGADAVENVQPLCKDCNSRKLNRTMDFRSNPFQGFPEPRRRKQNMLTFYFPVTNEEGRKIREQLNVIAATHGYTAKAGPKGSGGVGAFLQAIARGELRLKKL